MGSSKSNRRSSKTHVNWQRWRRLAKPQYILPALLTAAIVVFALKLGHLGDVLAHIKAIPLRILLYTLGLAAGYLVIKALQLHLLLIKLATRPGFRSFALAFAVGELTLTLPLGLFSQNWILAASSRIRVGRSGAATVVMLVAEVLVAMLLVAVVGVRGWPQLRLAMILCLSVFITGIVLLIVFSSHIDAHVHKTKHAFLRKPLQGAAELVRSLKKLLHAPVALGVNLLAAAGYLGALIMAFYFLGHGMGLHSLNAVIAASIYGFALVVVLLGVGAFTQIGTVEVLGVLAARQWGIDHLDSLVLMIGFRIVWTAAIWVLCMPIVAAFWRKVTAASKS